MALASLLLQKHYISLSTSKRWDSIEISYTEYGKPYYGNLQFNVSRANGIVVLVGYHEPIGVDIVLRDLVIDDVTPPDLGMLFSSLEREALSKCPEGREYNDLFLFDWAFKEAYFKYTGIPDWDNIASTEFLGIEYPTNEKSYITYSVAKPIVLGDQKPDYTESHFIENTHIVAIYTSSPPANEASKEFKRVTLEEIAVKNIENYR